MKTVNMHEAKTTLSQLIERAQRGEEIFIARDSKPVVRLVPLVTHKGDRKPGWLPELVIGPEFDEPLPPEELGCLGE
jgi:prevent-host-death family protein